MPRLRRPSRIYGTALAASSRSTVMRTNSEPARDSAATCAMVPSTSAVSVLVIDCTTIGAPPPTATLPTMTCVVLRRGSGPATSFFGAFLGLFMRSRISGFGDIHQGVGSAHGGAFLPGTAAVDRRQLFSCLFSILEARIPASATLRVVRILDRNSGIKGQSAGADAFSQVAPS